MSLPHDVCLNSGCCYFLIWTWVLTFDRKGSHDKQCCIYVLEISNRIRFIPFEWIYFRSVELFLNLWNVDDLYLKIFFKKSLKNVLYFFDLKKRVGLAYAIKICDLNSKIYYFFMWRISILRINIEQFCQEALWELPRAYCRAI